MNNMKIMICSDSFKHYSGLAYSAVSLMKRLAREYGAENIAYTSITNGESKLSDLNQFETDLSLKLKDISLFHGSSIDKNHLEGFNRAVVEFKPEIVISLTDPWMLDIISETPFRKTFFWCAYTLFETPDYPATVDIFSHVTNTRRKPIMQYLYNADLVIPVTQMTKDTLVKYNIPCTDVLHLGIDSGDLITSDKTSMEKSEFFDISSDIKNPFVFMTMGTNSGRKQMEYAVDAFSRFLRERKDRERFFLCIYGRLDSSLGGTDLYTQIIDANISQNLRVYENDSYKPRDRKFLYECYYHSDCYMAFPGGEGFSYGFAEAIVHDTPVIYQNYGGHVEYCKDYGISVEPVAFRRLRYTNIKWAIPDLNQAVKAMNKMVSDDKARSKFIKNTDSLISRLDWDEVIYPEFNKKVICRYNELQSSNMYGTIRRRSNI